MLKLEIERTANVIVLRCSGRIVRGEGADAILRAVVAEGDKHTVLIDLSGVSAIDAAGLGTLAEMERWARDGNRRLHLLNPSKRVRKTLEMTELSAVLQILPTTPAKVHPLDLAEAATKTGLVASDAQHGCREESRG